MSLKNTNLSEWALKNQPLVKYFLFLFLVLGIFGYTHLNQKEDPEFTVKAMVIKVNWPGATEQQMEDQVVDKLDKKLLELDTLDFTTTYIKPNEAQITVNLKDTARGQDVTDSWYTVRKKLSDIATTLPQGVQGPFFNDEFGDTYSNIFAFEADGYNYEELRRIVENVKREVLHVPGVYKADLLGTQNEQITINLSSTKLASLGIGLNQVLTIIQQQNAVKSAGSFNTSGDNIPVRVTGNFTSLDDIRNIALFINGKYTKLGDIAEIKREFINPPKTKIRFNGRPAILLALALDSNADVIKTGKDLTELFTTLKTKLPIGVEEFQVTDQPVIVKESVHEFTKGLFEAVVIVMVISFLSLGFRTGVVVAISIPLVLSVTFLVMYILGIDMQRISLGALVISLGLLVDDAIISVEMMVLKLEEGMSRFKAATFAYTSTAIPMLSGTLITVAGFLPVGFNSANAGEYTRSLFDVVAISLIVSWFVAVIFTPYLGYHLLPSFEGKAGHAHANLDKGFYKQFRKILNCAVLYKRTFVLATAGIFVLSLIGFSKFVPKQFFPTSSRLELMVDLNYPQEISIYNNESQSIAVENIIRHTPGVEAVTTFIGSGAPRFYLPLEVQQPNTNFTQLLVMTKDLEAREKVRTSLIKELTKKFPDIRTRIGRLENGPPVGYPVQFRVSGPDVNYLQQVGKKVEQIIHDDKQIINEYNDWGEDLRTMRLAVDQDKTREVGISSSSLQDQLNMMLSGMPTTYYFDKDETIPLITRLDDKERFEVDNLSNLLVQNPMGRFIPVGQLAKVEYAQEPSIKYRRTRVPTMTIKADVVDGAQGNDVSNRLTPILKAYEATLPLGYHIDAGGSVESSKKSQAAINKVVPLMLIVIMTILMLQLKSFSKSVIVLLTAPLGMIGVSAALIIAQQPFGFVATLGVVALLGIIMRNAVILIDQIDIEIASGKTQFDAIINSVLARFRPIMLTAGAAILGMVPLAKSTFWGPMAYAMMGGIFVATLLTLIFLPALYAWFYKVNYKD